MVDKLNDNHNEVLRGAAEIDSADSKYNLRVNVENKKSQPVQVANDADFRLMISYQSKILEELKKLNLYMAEFAEFEIEDGE